MLVAPLRQNREVALGLERVTVSPNRRAWAIEPLEEPQLHQDDPQRIASGESPYFLSSGAYLFDNRTLSAAAASGSLSLDYEFLSRLPQGSVQVMIQDQPILRCQKQTVPENNQQLAQYYD